MISKLKNIWNKITVYGRMIKFSHTVFALPFALSALVLANRNHPITLTQIFWILIAMVGARSAAMGVNRIADLRFDSLNPRTLMREIPSGKLSVPAAALFVCISSLLFIYAAAMLGSLPFWFSVPVLLVLFSYSYTKRFTWLAHLYLGFAISLAPLGTWVALTNTLTWEILLLSLALMTYMAGFDILYACQDVDFDISQGLFSIPAYFGVPKAMGIARMIHIFAYGAFLAIYFAFDMGPVYLMAACLIGFLLLFEHWLVDPHDLSRIHIAFFHVNSVVSTTLFIGILADEILR